ncbi:enoyl-ACP reductase FabI [Granulicoccus sp. GXG6511]|uniref:enoyl-ACP reductase FabI n=1 Tax=Granulicoccus sp. GXG6511 TaxID=3381351 RepID=UPI003D7EA650
MSASMMDLSGKKGLIVGLANERSLAYGVARTARALGADLVTTCLNDKARKYVQPLTDDLGVTLLNLNVEEEGALEAVVDQAVAELGQLDFVVHSIAWAPLADLHGRIVDSSPEGFARAMTVSCHSFAELGRLCAPHMPDGGSMLTMTYIGSEQAIPNYGIMGPIKAALEATVRYMALELGTQGIRVHAVSSGPVRTRAASGLSDFDGLLHLAESKSPMKRLVSLDEVAGLSAFLCTDAASGMTGQTLFVDAGYHIAA